MGYEIRVVSNEEFDTLPYKHVKRALGLADARNRVAYVRHTGVKDLDDRTIDHEFDELLMKVSPHEEDGIRYKFWIPLIVAALKSAAIGAAVGGTVTKIKGGDFWKGALQGAKWGAIGSGVGSALGGVGGAMGGSANAAVSSVGGGLSKVGSLMGGANFSGAGGAGAGGSTIMNPTQAAKIATQGGAGVTGGATSAAAGGLTAGATAGSQGALSGFAGSAGTAAGTSQLATGGSTTPSTTPSAGDVTATPMTVGSAGSPLAAAPTSAAAPAGRSLMSKFGDFSLDQAGKFAGNTLSTAAGNAIAPAEQGLFPEYRTPASGYGSEGALSRFAPSLSGGGAFTPLSQQEYETGLSNLYGAKETSTARLFGQDAFRGQDPSQNTALAQQLAELNKGFDLELSQYNKDIDTENIYRKYDSIMKENELTDDLMSQYIALADKSDEEISQSVTNSPEEFRAIFQGLKKRG